MLKTAFAGLRDSLMALLTEIAEVLQCSLVPILAEIAEALGATRAIRLCRLIKACLGLHPCPNCRSRRLKIVGPLTEGFACPQYVVTCRSCKTLGQLGRDPQWAAALWNLLPHRKGR